MQISFEELKARLKDHWNELDESQRTVRKVAMVAVALGIIAVPAWLFGWPQLRRWQHEQALQQMKLFTAQNDYRSAVLALRRAMQLDSGNPAMWQEAVRLLNAIGSPEVLVAREQLVRLNPQDQTLRIAVIEEALRLERLEVAQNALDEMDATARQDAAFFRLAAALAQASGRSDEVERNLEKLLSRAPDDVVARLDYTALRLWHADAAKAEEARLALVDLTNIPGVRVRAAVELLQAAARANDERRMQETVATLQGRFIPGWQADWPTGGVEGWTKLVEHLAIAAAEDGGKAVASFARWRSALGQPRETLLWLEGLPSTLLAERDVKDVAAEISARLGDLERVETYLRDGAWGVWPREVLTLAIAARLQLTRYTEAQGRGTWENALQAAESSLPALRALSRLASAWGDQTGFERTLQTIIQRFPKTYWAYQALSLAYTSRRDVAGLWSVYDGWQKHWPGDSDRTMRWVMLAALTDRVTSEVRQRAEELHRERTDWLPARVALAAVRWRAGKPAEAVELLTEDEAAAEAGDSVNFWLGLAYADLGRAEEAARCLRAAARTRMSAEEAKLFQAAATKAKVQFDSLN